MSVPRVVIAAGGYRSGSTLQYNLLGVYVEAAGIGRRLGWVDPDDAVATVAQWRSTGRGVGVVKCHHVAPGFRHYADEAAWARLVRAGAATAVTTRRDEAAVRRSMCRKFGHAPADLDASLEWRENLANEAAWAALGGWQQAYEDLVERPVPAVQALARHLGLPWRRRAAFAARRATRPAVVRRQQRGIAAGEWDPVTLIHHDHIA